MGFISLCNNTQAGAKRFKDGFKKSPSLSDGEGLKETFMPEDSGAFVFDVEEPEELEVDDSLSNPLGVSNISEAVVIDKYQTIPMAEIKVENPFEELPFHWGNESNALEDYFDNDVEIGLEETVIFDEDIEDEQFILGLSKESTIIVESIMSSLIEKVKSVCQLQEAEEEIVELFEEEVHDPTKTGISHQVYLKDFD